MNDVEVSLSKSKDEVKDSIDKLKSVALNSDVSNEYTMLALTFVEAVMDAIILVEEAEKELSEGK